MEEKPADHQYPHLHHLDCHDMSFSALPYCPPRGTEPTEAMNEVSLFSLKLFLLGISQLNEQNE